MKKILLSLSAIALLGFSSVKAETLSVTLPAAGVTNTVGYAKITQFILTSTATNAASIKAFDAPSTILNYTNPAYIDIRSYATNFITCYTNFFGIQNCFTNIALVDAAHTNAVTTNAYPMRIAAMVNSNSSAVFDGVNYYFHQGILLTNDGTGPVTVTATFQR